jgi:hypothetical protein
MAADDAYDVVHEKVKIGADFKYGCNSREGMAKGYWVKDRIYLAGDGGRFEYHDKWIPHRMSTKCRNFYLWDSHAPCRECTTEKDHEYAERMKGME